MPAQTQPKKKVNIISLDFDGCIFNEAYVNSTSPNRLLEANQAFLKSIAERIVAEQFDEVVLMIGSNRQSWKIDRMNAFYGNKGSCFPALPILQTEIQRLVAEAGSTASVACDTYLLADAYGNKQSGESYVAALKELEEYTQRNELRRKAYSVGEGNKYIEPDPEVKYKQLLTENGLVDIEHADWAHDKSKVTLIYAQMRKKAVDYPNADIIYDFYDDLNDILSGLNKFFGNMDNKEDFIPPKVSLRLNRYDGGDIATYDEVIVSQNGKVRDCFEEDIKQIAEICGYNAKNGNFLISNFNIHKFRVWKDINYLKLKLENTILTFDDKALNDAYQRVYQQFRSRIASLEIQLTNSKSQDPQKLQKETKWLVEFFETFEDVAQQVMNFDPKHHNGNLNELATASKNLKLTIKKLDDSLFSGVQEVLAVILKFFGAVIFSAGGVLLGAFIGTQIGALLGLPASAATGPVGPAVTASAGTVVGAGIGGLIGAKAGWEAGHKLAAFGIFKFDKVKGSIHKFTENALAQVNAQQKQQSGGNVLQQMARCFC